MTIRNKYPELSKYLEEMPVTIPDDKHPAITISKMQEYYDSLKSILENYVAEHPEEKSKNV